MKRFEREDLWAVRALLDKIFSITEESYEGEIAFLMGDLVEYGVIISPISEETCCSCAKNMVTIPYLGISEGSYDFGEEPFVVHSQSFIIHGKLTTEAVLEVYTANTDGGYHTYSVMQTSDGEFVYTKIGKAFY